MTILIKIRNRLQNLYIGIFHSLNARKGNDQLVIRKITSADLPHLNKSFPSEYLRSHKDDLEAQERGELSFYFVWLGKYAIAHTLICWDGPRSPEVKKEFSDYPEIYRLIVLEQYRRRGIGGLLVEACCQEARERGFKSIGLGVDFDNDKAQSLYKRVGFEQSSIEHYIDAYETLGDKGQTIKVEEPGTWLIKEL